ncbi:MAG: phosphoadenosine phosphosulfate reductase domain-containing protein [Candidatus Heimdallarchaeota archaeon]
MSKRKTVPYLGAFKLSWCDSCNLPILDAKPCGICKAPTRKVILSPPGDVRPAFAKDVKRIGKIIDEKFGKGSAHTLGLSGKRLVLLNETSYDDVMEEIIIDGQIVGSIRYNLALMQWDFIPRIIGAIRIFEKQKEKKKYVQVDEGAVEYIANGYNVLAPGVEAFDETLQDGEIAVAISPQGKVLSIGVMKVNADKIKQMKKGYVLKPKSSLKDFKKLQFGNSKAKNQTWEQAVLANSYTIEAYERKAIKSIKKTMYRYPELPLTVSFSGGKDSLVCLQLANKIPDLDFNIIFVNTSLEFPETIQYIEDVIEQMDLSENFCRKDIPEEKFWKAVKKFGPPGKDYRYCCKILKIGPVNNLIEECIGEKTLSLVGQRAYESISRSESRSLWSNPWIPNQLNFSPIQKWTALHVWLYIFKEKLMYNPLYEEGLSRIGCWLCPASNQGSLELIKEIQPELWKNWEEFLIQWQNKNKLPDEWHKWGLWRWKQLPKNITALAAQHDVDISYEKRTLKEPGDWDLHFELIENFATCRSGNINVEGYFTQALNLPRLEQFWRIFAETEYDSDLGILIAKLGDVSIVISANGSVIAKGDELKPVVKLMKKLVLEVYRSEECTGCKVCLIHCKTKAITIDDEINQVVIDQKLCEKSMQCHYHCPVIKYGHKEINDLFDENIKILDQDRSRIAHF